MTTRRPRHLVPTAAQLRELYLLRQWVAPPSVESLAEDGDHRNTVNRLLRNDIKTLDELYPLYLAIRAQLTGEGRMRTRTWAERAEWLPRPLEEIGAARSERLVEIYEEWAQGHRQLADAIEDNHGRRTHVSPRCRMVLRAYMVDELSVGEIAGLYGVPTERVRQQLNAAGLSRDLRRLFDINVAWRQHWDNVPCRDKGRGPCEGHHEICWPTWWDAPAGNYDVLCTRHAEQMSEGDFF